MSRYGQKNELVWELRENEAQRRRRARILRSVYALCDLNGWDARKLGVVGMPMIPGVRIANLGAIYDAGEQAAHHPRDRVAGHVPSRAEAHVQERVTAGLP